MENDFFLKNRLEILKGTVYITLRTGNEMIKTERIFR